MSPAMSKPGDKSPRSRTQAPPGLQSPHRGLRRISPVIHRRALWVFILVCFTSCTEDLASREHYDETPLDIKLDVIVGDSVWNPPDGFFDHNLMAQPGNFQNVENGFGFIGSGYRITADVYPSREVVEAACFAYAPPCARIGANCTAVP